MFARVARYEVEPSRTQEAIDAFHAAVAELEGTNGLEGGYVCVDHEDGAIMSMTLWQNRTAMDESERKAAGLRQEAAKRSKAGSSPCSRSTSRSRSAPPSAASRARPRQRP